jgi:hypothetical protein
MLGITLENVLAQVAGHPEVEVVVSDNASTDHTQEVLARHPGLVVDRLEHTVGVTRNIGHAVCDLARGDFIWILGDDDLVIAGGLERVLTFLREHPAIGYVYLNFGWIDARARQRVVRERGSVPELDANSKWQLQDFSTRVLARMEDLVFLPNQNPSVLFSLLMCYVTRREVYLHRWGALEPSDSLDGSSTRIDDCFPHAKVTIESFAGQPIGYIGDPCFMQGCYAWLWKAYALKCNLFGISQFIQWLEGTRFAPDAIEVMWDKFYPMAGRLFSRMVCEPEEHLGRDLVIDQVVRPGIARESFWASFTDELAGLVEQKQNTEFFLEEVGRLLAVRPAGSPSPRIGVWGVWGVGTFVVRRLQALGLPPVWVGDRSRASHGREVTGTDILVSPLDTLPSARLDVLVLAMKRTWLDEVAASAGPWLEAIDAVVTARGTYRGGELGRPGTGVVNPRRPAE